MSAPVAHARGGSGTHKIQSPTAEMCRQFALGGLLGVLVLAAQVGPARAYACTSDAECQYDGCHDVSCACSWCATCNNGVWDARCVSTTYTSTTSKLKLSALCCHFPVSLYYGVFWRVEADFWDSGWRDGCRWTDLSHGIWHGWHFVLFSQPSPSSVQWPLRKFSQ